MKEHKKLYKHGKLWVTATIFAATLGIAVGTGQAQAATEPATTTPAVQQVGQTTTGSSQNGRETNQQPSATTPQQDTNRGTAVTSQATTDQTNINPNDHGNYGWLDQAKLNSDGSLNVSGWHATNESQGRQYHYIIAFDPTHNVEIARQNITDHEVSRPDIAKNYHVAGAGQSGFSAVFNFSSQLANLDRIQIISRYTDDAAGNGNSIDYWFAPIMVSRANLANLDKAIVADNQLVLSGWHATNLAADKEYHYIILLDRTTNKEVTRVKVDVPVARPDIVHAFPGIYHGNQSGFTVKLPIEKINFNHQLQVISRYSSQDDGNSDYVDYWFTPLTTGQQNNQGHLDSIDLSDGEHLTFSGWHASPLAAFETNHFGILFDLTSNAQVTSVNTEQVYRPDITRFLAGVPGAGQSGFNGQINLTGLNLQPGHRYVIVSRYSTSSEGNGGNGQYSDFWSAPFTLNQRASYIEGIKMTKEGLQVNGWMISDQSLNKSHPYLLVMNDGKEDNRVALNLTSRPDIAKIYGGVYNSANSGFSALVKLNPTQITGNMQLILRFSDDEHGNGNCDDQYSPVYLSSAGHFDAIQVSPQSIYVAGWHASNQSVNKPYQWLIFIDSQTGHELWRQQVLDANRTRGDVAKSVPAIYNSGKSGYQLGFNIPNQLNHHMVRIIHRITDDKYGNGNAVDEWSGLVSINAMRTPIDYRQPSEYFAYPNLSQLNNFWIHVRIGQNRVYLMNNNDVVYTMYCTAGYYQNGVSTTPLGTYYIQAERGNSFYNGALGEGANYWTSFLNHGEYLFHTVPTDRWGNYKPYEASQLGINQGSHGCIRLSIPDAYWIMHNVPTGTRVVIDN